MCLGCKSSLKIFKKLLFLTLVRRYFIQSMVKKGYEFREAIKSG